MKRTFYKVRSAIIFICAVILIVMSADKASARKTYHISRPKLAFDVSYEFDREKRTGPFVNKNEDTTTYSERLDITTGGWVYHPALVEYTLTLSPEWEQIYEEPSDAGRSTTRTYLQGYDAEFIFLQYKPYTVTLFGNRTMETVNSNLARKSKIISDTYGMRVDLKYSILPTIIDYTHDESNQTGFFASSSEQDEVRINMKYDRHMGDTRLDMSFLDATEITSFANTGTTSKNATLQNVSRLPGNKNKTLTSFIEYRDRQSNTFIERGVNWRENLRWEHARNLTTNYSLRIESMDLQEGKRREYQAANFELNHLLYENLTTIVRTDASKNDNKSGQESVYGAGLEWNYVRAIPGGRININVGHNYRVYDKQPDLLSTSINEPQEAVTLTNNDLTFLNNPDVIISTIKVYKNNGGLKGAEVPASDYEIITIGTSTGIKRSLSSTLLNPDNVLVDYSSISEPPFDFAVYDKAYGLSLSLWKSLDIYYRYFNSKQIFLRGIEPENLRTYISNTVGSEYRWKWSTSSVEYIDIESTELPMETWRVSENLVFRPTSKMYLSLNAAFGKTRYKALTDDNNTDRFQSYRAAAQMLLNPRSNVTLEGFLNKASGVVNKSRDRGFKALMEWVYNIYKAEIQYAFEDEEDKTSGESFQNHLFMFTIKRRLF